MATDYLLDPNISPELAIEAERLRRRRQIADTLMAGSMRPLHSTQAGRFIVPPGWAQNLGQLGQALAGAYIEHGTNEAYEALGEKQRRVAEASMANFMGPITRAPASPQYIRGPGESPPTGPPSVPVQTPPAVGEPIPASVPPAAPSPTGAEKVAWELMPTPKPALGTPDEKMAHAMRFMSDLSQPPAVRHAAQLYYQGALQEREHAATREAHRTTVAPGGTVLNAEGKPIYTAPITPSMEHASPLARLLKEKAGLTPDSALHRAYDAAIAKESAGKGQNISNLARLMAERDALPAGSPDRKKYDEAIKKESEPQARPTVTEVIDPLNPNRTIKIDARTGREIGAAATYSDLAKKFKSSTETEIAFSKGPEARSLRSISVAHDHLSTWEKAATALQNGDVPAFNRIANALVKGTGKPQPTNLEGIAAIVAPEIVKAIVPGGGGELERQALEKKLGSALAPGQSAGLAQEIRTLMMGQAKGLKGQYLGGGGTEAGWTQRISQYPELHGRMKSAEAMTQPQGNQSDLEKRLEKYK